LEARVARRAILLVLDGVGVGELPDAAAFGDAGSNTLGNLARAVGGLALPNLQRLGLGNILPLEGVPPDPEPLAAWGRMIEKSQGKDSTLGHWELVGLVTTRALPTYPQGFPPELVSAFVRASGLPGVLGNEVASGTEIIARLGDGHVASGKPILYTSADSVFQLAAHEETIPLAELYRICEIARGLLAGEHAVARVIARPFAGASGAYERTANRRDFSLPPHGPTALDRLREGGVRVAAIGKIHDLFAGVGIDEHRPSKSNMQGLDRLLEWLAEPVAAPACALLNLVDFDMLWGHRLDPVGFKGGLEAFDARLPGLLEMLGTEDLLLITADHGNDPTSTSTDHSREHVPLLAYCAGLAGAPLGTRSSFADAGATLVDWFGLPALPTGASVLTAWLPRPPAVCRT
jgi:phosphopentomutase